MTDTTEIWKDVPGYEGRYQISNFGRAKSLPRLKEGTYNYYLKGQILSPIMRCGYPSYGFRKDGRTTLFVVHRLVAEAFIPNPQNKPHINHIDGNKNNPHYSNLEWCTPLENTAHAVKTGLHILGERVGIAKLNPQKAAEIRAKYIPRKYSQRKLAKEYGVDQQVIWSIINNKTWITPKS